MDGAASQVVPPAAANMDSVLVQTLVQNMHQQQEATLAIQQNMHLLQQVMARPTGGKCNVRLTSFSASHLEEYSRFEQTARNAIKANNWSWPAAGYAIKGALEGVALDVARSTEPEDYNNLEEFLAALRELFLTPAFKRKARADFLTRIQRPGEDIAVFHGILKDLWERAYEQSERNENHLIEQFIAGMTHREANKQLHMDNAVGNLPTKYKDVLVRASSIISECQIIEQEERRRAASGHGEAERNPSLWLQAAPAPPAPTPSPFPPPVPMEIGAVTGPSRWCEFHRSTTHNTKDCRAKNNQQLPTNRTGFRPGQHPTATRTQAQGTRTQTSGPRPQAINTWKPRGDRCSNCGGLGHWKAQCPSAPGGRTNPKGMTHQTNVVMEQEPAEDYVEN